MKRYCKVCGAPLSFYNQSGYCIHHYHQQHRNYKKCVVCGKLFPCPPSLNAVCCSSGCSAVHMANVARNNPQNIAAAMKKAETSPICQPNENHHGAKTWVLLSPDGTIYRCRNLLHWCRTHADLLDGTPRQAWDGFSKIKYTLQGKRKHPSRTWKGWRLLSYGD